MSETAAPASTTSSQEAEILTALGKRLIVLVGMMGAGKSSIGRRLAGRLGIPFADADNEIETAAGMSVPDIFSTYGEPDFRAGETRVIARLLEKGRRCWRPAAAPS
jgi:shikimate kinase